MSVHEEEPPPHLSMPAQLWCPRCGIHNRSMDVYGNSMTPAAPPTQLQPLCPICQDDEDKLMAEEESKYSDEGGNDVIRIREP